MASQKQVIDNIGLKSMWNFGTFVTFSVQDKHRIRGAAFEEILNSAITLSSGKKKELLWMIEEYMQYKRSIVPNLKFDPMAYGLGMYPLFVRKVSSDKLSSQLTPSSIRLWKWLTSSLVLQPMTRLKKT